MRSRKVLLLAGALAVLSLGVVACGGDDDGDGGSADVDLTVGDLVPLTGDLSDFGTPGQKAADLAAAEIEAAGGTITLNHEDTETKPQASVQAARKAIADGATCLTGAWASADTIPVFESVSSREGILQISPASTSDEITALDDPDGLMNRTAPPDSFQGPTMADFMEQEIGGAEGLTVNVGARNDAYGTGLADTFSAAWEAKGGTIGERIDYDPEQPSYDSEAGQLTSGNPDAWFIVDFPETYAKVGPALVRTGEWDPKKTFVPDGLISGDLAADAGSDAVNGMRGTAPGAPDEGSPTEEFDTAYAEFEPTDVDRQVFDAQNFDAVMLCYLAAVAAGSTDGTEMAAQVRDISSPPGDEFTYVDLEGAVDALVNGEDIDYNGTSGQIDMDEVGDATAGVYDTFEFKNDAPEVIGEVPVGEKVE